MFGYRTVGAKLRCACPTSHRYGVWAERSLDTYPGKRGGTGGHRHQGLRQWANKSAWILPATVGQREWGSLGGQYFFRFFFHGMPVMTHRRTILIRARDARGYNARNQT